MDLYDILALIAFVAVAAAMWRAFRPGEDAVQRYTTRPGCCPEMLKALKRKTIPREEVQKDEAADDIALRAEKLSHIDRSFEPQAFMEQAKDMFQAVLKAFEGGDKARLKGMVSPAVLGIFGRAMDGLAAQGRRVETEIVRFKRIFIKDIETGKRGFTLGRRRASVTIEFQTEQTVLVKDKAGNVIEGDDNQIELVRDVWKFSKDFSARRPAWVLEETLAGTSAAEESKDTRESRWLINSK